MAVKAGKAKRKRAARRTTKDLGPREASAVKGGSVASAAVAGAIASTGPTTRTIRITNTRGG